MGVGLLRCWSGSREVGLNESALRAPFPLRMFTSVGAVIGVVGTIVGLWGLVQLMGSTGPFQLGDDAVPKPEFLGPSSGYSVVTG